MSDTYTRLMALDVSPLHDAAASWRKLAAACRQAQTDHSHQVLGPLYGSWTGESGKAAIEQLQQIGTELDAGEVDAISFATLLETTHTNLEGAQNSLRSAVTGAEAAGFTVDATGAVHLPSWLASEARQDPEQYVADSDSWGQAAQEYQDLINAALRAAETADQQASAALNALDPEQMESMYAGSDVAASASAVDTALGITVAGLPDGKDPKTAATWWKSLSPDEQQTYIATDPKLIGNLNGLPATARDQANRLALTEFISSPGPGKDWNADQWNGAYNAALNFQGSLDKGLSNSPEQQLYLMGFDPHGEAGRAIVAMGNPDHAQNTAILVPGTDTNLGNMPGQINRIGNIYGAAYQEEPHKSLSVISWLGYDAPQDTGGGTNDLGVAGTGRAEAGGASLRQFVAATRVTQGGTHSNLTVIGHSYGSTTVGAAAAGSPHGLGAQNIILIGSPGATVDHASDLHLSPSHVFVERANDDPIVNGFSNMTLGPDPALDTFGATRLATDSHGHSGYWNTGPHQESLDNQAKVIVGKPPATTAPVSAQPDVPRHPWYH